jgi:hypothetical protein
VSCLPFRRRGVWSDVADAEAAQVPANPLRIYNRDVPGAVIDHRAFDRKFARITIDNDENELPLGHQCAPGTAYPSRLRAEKP